MGTEVVFRCSCNYVGQCPAIGRAEVGYDGVLLPVRAYVPDGWWLWPNGHVYAPHHVILRQTYTDELARLTALYDATEDAYEKVCLAMPEREAYRAACEAFSAARGRLPNTWPIIDEAAEYAMPEHAARVAAANVYRHAREETKECREYFEVVGQLYDFKEEGRKHGLE